MELILASRSPQRRAILEQLGIEFSVEPADVEELEAGEPVRVACENARRKMEAVEGEIVLGVDTVVALDGRIYGKPENEEDATSTLSALSGRTHEVVTGLAVQDEVDCAITRVTFRALSDELLSWYVGTGEWRDRAGGYAIQGRGAALVERIEGDYLNVVGLPVALLLDRLPWLIGAAR
ncbi:MAG TPA: Maf family protein [Solirubrobacteraceae bacterium]|nr:Maf family protein [Solirubrobacteraceae bacterium]